MRARLLFLAGIVSLATGFLAAQAMYSQTGDVQIGGPLPAQWDYVNVDSQGKRLYVSHGNAEVVVIDTGTEKVVGRIADTPGVHGIAIGSGRLFTSNGRENKVSIVDAKTLQTVSKVDSGGANPDAITYDAKKNEVWVFNHTGKSATQMDASGKVIATIPLSGTAETGQVDSAAGRAYVNIEDKDAVDVIDIAAKKVIATWPVTPGSEPTGMLVVGEGGNATAINVSQQIGANILSIRTGLEATLVDLAKSLPAGLKIIKTYDLAAFVQTAIANVRDAIIIGGLLAVLVLLFFLRNWRLTLVAACTLPITVVCTFFFMSERQGRDDRGWLEVPILVEHVIGRQQRLVLTSDDAS